MRTVTFEELKPGMIVRLVSQRLEALILEINRYDPFCKSPSIGFLNIANSYHGRRYIAIQATDQFNVLHEHDKAAYISIVKKIEQSRLQCIRDAEEDCEMLQRFLNNEN